MLKYTLRRLARHLSTIWLIAAVTFLLVHSSSAFDMQHGCWMAPSDVLQRFIRDFDLDQPLVQRFFSYMLVDVEEGQQTAISRLDFGAFGVYQIGPADGVTLQCGVLCLNLGPSYRQRGKDVEDILFGPVP